jgi:two-component system, sensor histidine kinase and response regulator
MIVDDNPANLRLLEDMLTREGHEVRSFPLGRLALAAAAKDPPDLILLDVNMPEMDGYEVCQRLKSNAELRAVPTIFLSALSAPQDRLKAFESGAVDYISKPFQFEEVHARVETHLSLYYLQRALELHNRDLEEAVAARTRELAEANRRLTVLDRSKSDFLNLISHEFRTPLHGLLGVSSLILEGMPTDGQSIKLKGAFQNSRRRILSILDDAVLLTEIEVNREQFRFVPLSLNTAMEHATEKVADLACSRDVSFSPIPVSTSVVLGNEELLTKAYAALFEAAIRFSARGECVQLSHEVERDTVTVVIETRGEPLPEASLEKLFDLLAVGEASMGGVNLGLGLAAAKRIISLFGGSASAANRESGGIRLTATLKLADGA